jgi:[FeFe] hydrogenase H-cluster maturation GTPase HydF
MNSTPKSLRLQVGFFGRTNTGKSSLVNYIAGQDVSITASMPGTTTDIVEKSMELLPVGPVVLLDTAGIDDVSEVGEHRVARTKKVFMRSDIAVLVVEPDTWGVFEDDIVERAKAAVTPLVVVINKSDTQPPQESVTARAGEVSSHVLITSAVDRPGRILFVEKFTNALLAVLPDEFRNEPTLLGDLVPAGGLIIFIVPIDLQAPKGRLILPQVQALRDALDNDAAVLVVKEREYAAMLTRLAAPPDLVVCDSQVVLKMVADTPPGIPCTTFSILFARFKGDLVQLAEGAAAIDSLKDGDTILIAEACSHHAMEDDIGRVKIPRWIRQYTGLECAFDVSSGRDFPDNLQEYNLVIHCGSCMLNSAETRSRLQKAKEAGVPVVNYGVCISAVQGVITRTLSPFPSVLMAYEDALEDYNRTEDT